jgi:hypothetical protein
MLREILFFMKTIVKFTLLFISGLYLVGFGWARELNLYGRFDAVLPYEWVLCVVIGTLMLGWSIHTALRGLKYFSSARSSENQSSGFHN